MKYYKSNGNTDLVYHTLQIGKTKFSMTTFELWKMILKFVFVIILFTGFMFKYVFPIYVNVTNIPEINERFNNQIDTLGKNIDTLKLFAKGINDRHNKEDSLNLIKNKKILQ